MSRSGRRRQHVAALGDALGAGALEHRDALAGQDEPDRTAAVRRAPGSPATRTRSRWRRRGAPPTGPGSPAARPGARSAGGSGRPRRARSSRASTRRSVSMFISAASRTARPHVVGELQERAAVRAGRAVQHDAGQDRAHRVLADAEVQGAAVRVGGPVLRRDRRRPERIRALDRGVVAARQVGRAAPQLGQHRRRRVQHLAGTPRGWPAPLVSGSQDGRSASQPSGSSRASSRSSSALRSGSRAAQASNSALPLLRAPPCRGPPACGCARAPRRDLEGLLRVEAEDLLDRGDLLVAQRGRRAPCRCSSWSAPGSR